MSINGKLVNLVQPLKVPRNPTQELVSIKGKLVRLVQLAHASLESVVLTNVASMLFKFVQL